MYIKHLFCAKHISQPRSVANVRFSFKHKFYLFLKLGNTFNRIKFQRQPSYSVEDSVPVIKLLSGRSNPPFYTQLLDAEPGALPSTFLLCQLPHVKLSHMWSQKRKKKRAPSVGFLSASCTVNVTPASLHPAFLKHQLNPICTSNASFSAPVSRAQHQSWVPPAPGIPVLTHGRHSPPWSLNFNN